MYDMGDNIWENKLHYIELLFSHQSNIEFDISCIEKQWKYHYWYCINGIKIFSRQKDT